MALLFNLVLFISIRFFLFLNYFECNFVFSRRSTMWQHSLETIKLVTTENARHVQFICVIFLSCGTLNSFVGKRINEWTKRVHLIIHCLSLHHSLSFVLTPRSLCNAIILFLFISHRIAVYAVFCITIAWIDALSHTQTHLYENTYEYIGKVESCQSQNLW